MRPLVSTVIQSQIQSCVSNALIRILVKNVQQVSNLLLMGNAKYVMQRPVISVTKFQEDASDASKIKTYILIQSLGHVKSAHLHA